MSHTVLSLRRTWSSLQAPALDSLAGDWEAEFVAPLRTVAPVGLGWIGLPRWYGKRLRADSGTLTGTNLLRTPTGLTETLPMEVALELSRIDAHPAVVVSYARGSRKPWPWVVDELRTLDDDTVLGMTVVDLPVLRRAGGTPFLLRRR